MLWLQCACLLWAAALLRVPPWRACAVVVLSVFGTGLFHYATYDGSFTHAYSAFFVALLLAFAAREQVSGKPMPKGLLVAAAFFLFALRNTNVLLVLGLTAACVIWRRTQPRSHIVWRKLVPIGVGLGSAIALQLSYNFYAVGAFTAEQHAMRTAMPLLPTALAA